MMFRWNRALALVVVAGASILLTGCGGFSASPSVSPATFFLPGIGQTPVRNEPGPTPGIQEKNGSGVTNTLVVVVTTTDPRTLQNLN